MKILRKSEVVYSYINFYYFKGNGIPWGVDCDEDGNDLDPTKVPPRELWRDHDCPVKKTYTKVIPTLIKCYCGEEFEIPFFTNECTKCGALYNSYAQSLRPQEEWEEDDIDDP
jgi:hypothetical protein